MWHAQRALRTGPRSGRWQGCGLTVDVGLEHDLRRCRAESAAQRCSRQHHSKGERRDEHWQGRSGLQDDGALRASLQRELAARSGGDAPAPDRVAGFVIYGDIPDMEYSALIGTFELTPAAALPPSLLGRLPIPSAWGSSLT